MSGVIYYIILVRRQTINFLSEIVKNHCVALDISFEKKNSEHDDKQRQLITNRRLNLTIVTVHKAQAATYGTQKL
jgi:hypothetical protein